VESTEYNLPHQNLFLILSVPRDLAFALFTLSTIITTTDECTIKKSDGNGFSDGFGYNTFSTIETMCTDCANDDTCKDLVDESVQCADGYAVDYDGGDDDGIDDNRLCKLFKQASKERQYAKRKREFTIMPVIFLLLLLGWFAASGTYTYFIRHKRASEAALLEKDDDLNDTNDSSKVHFAQLA
jgi:hypothetical protein